MAQSLSHLIVHLVFSTKDREKFIKKPVRPDLNAYLAGILRKDGNHAISINSVDNHVHILFIMDKKNSISKTVETVKSASSKWMKSREGVSNNFKWQAGYSAFSVSQSNVSRVKAYIENQEEHHKAFDFKAELLSLLEKHKMEFNSEYLWD